MPIPSPFAYRGRGEPKACWLEEDTPPSLNKHEHQLFSESCQRIDARNKGLAEIARILRETREGLAGDNAQAEGGAA